MPAGRDVLLDTGPIIGLLDPRDQRHREAAATWPRIATRCLTTEAVVVEATHLVSRGRGDAAQVLALVTGLDIPIVALHLALHQQCAQVMRGYADVPMDYADATLVVLGERLGIRRVFTFDRRGFNRYRAGGRAFEILPAAGTS